MSPDLLPIGLPFFFKDIEYFEYFYVRVDR